MIGFAREEMSRSGILMRKFSPGQVKREDWLIPAEEMAGGIIELIKPGEIVLITGASGSGKSMLMREIGKQLGARASATVDLELPDRLVIDTMRWLELEEALAVLCRFGLGEVHSYLASVRNLSTGQRFRLCLAIAYARLRRPSRLAPSVLLADEFATSLDRTSAAIIARNLSRVITAGSSAAIVATCHDDLEKALRPVRVVRCDFGAYSVHAGMEVSR